ncbi:arylsulfotransferase family protein [Defluviimonas sp. SAOS-178_SWC]|uniref:arylsulfotransferase family protein n=1 Tax=Defluviimonas sp. SAOS-178_SWC TaxID=3121287 RepID=UPI0032217A0F
MKPETLQRISTCFLISMVALVVGILSGLKEWTPATLYTTGQQIVLSLRDTGRVLPEHAYSRRRAGSPDERYVVNRPESIAPGDLLINRLQLPENRFVTELLDERGEVIGSWPSDYSNVVENGKPGGTLQATYPLPDGSLLLAYDQGTALVRVDICGKILWSRTDQTYHHAIRPDEDAGGFWVWQAGMWYGGDDQRLVRFDEETGEILESIDLIDDIILRSPASKVAFGFPDGFNFYRDLPEEASSDVFHPNDIKPLPARLARAFPQFKPGDLLISLRNINLLAVVDRTTKQLLWSRHGPWQEQHDPDWQADGTITVYSNNQRRGVTTILKIDPKTDLAEDLFADASLRFFSRVMGQHQLLPNGNWLIVSPLEGAAIEVSPAGEILREVSNRLTGEFNGILSYAQLLPPGYFTAPPRCGR